MKAIKLPFNIMDSTGCHVRFNVSEDIMYMVFYKQTIFINKTSILAVVKNVTRNGLYEKSKTE